MMRDSVPFFFLPNRIHSLKFFFFLHGCHGCCCINSIMWNKCFPGMFLKDSLSSAELNCLFTLHPLVGTLWHSAEESINKGFQPVTCTFWVLIVTGKANWDCLLLICLWPFQAFAAFLNFCEMKLQKIKNTSISCCFKRWSPSLSYKIQLHFINLRVMVFVLLKVFTDVLLLWAHQD